MPEIEPGPIHPLKILYHHRIASKDGQAVHIGSLIAALREAGHRVYVVAPPTFDRADFGGQSSFVARLKSLLPQMVYEFLEIAYNLPVFWRLDRARRQFRPDLIYERYNLFTIAGMALARLHGLPIMLEVNSPLAEERSAFGGLALPRLARWLERLTWRSADFVLPVTKVLADIVEEAGVDVEKVAVIPNGINLEEFDDLDRNSAKSALGLSEKIVLGFVGFLRNWHGLDRALELMKDPACPSDIHLLIIGDGPALPVLRSRATQLGVTERVTFVGLVDRCNVRRYVAAFDIALQPRVVSYASPLKIFEYMACRAAILAPNQQNIREILVHERTAILFDPSDGSAFRNAVFKLVSDAGLRDYLGVNAKRVLIENNYTWSGNASRVVSLLARCSSTSTT